MSVGTVATEPATRARTSRKGPISKLPPEMVVSILDLLTESCEDEFERQSAGLVFSRVNGAFRCGYQLSSVRHDCALKSTKQATKLTARLNDQCLTHLKVNKLLVRLDSRPRYGDRLTDVIIANLIKACGPELRSVVITAAHDWSFDVWTMKAVLPRAWADCHELQEIEFWGHERQVSPSQAQAMLAAWTKMTDLRLINIWVGSERNKPTLSSPVVDWTLPTRLRSLELLVWNVATRDLFAALILSSRTTLRHLGLGYCYDVNSDEVQAGMLAAVDPVADAITSFRCFLPGEADGPYTFIAAVLGALTRLETLEIPLGGSYLGAIATAFVGQSRHFRSVALYDRNGGSGDSWDELLDFLRAVKVDVLKLSASWYFLYDDENWEENHWGDETREEALDEAKADVMSMGVGEFGWLEFGEWR